MAEPISDSTEVPTHGYVTHMPQARGTASAVQPLPRRSGRWGSSRTATIPQGGTGLRASKEGREMGLHRNGYGSERQGTKKGHGDSLSPAQLSRPGTDSLSGTRTHWLLTVG